ncbi:MAG: hypothetical protein K2F53_04105, partial [Rikenellaceae bacterium]|nr:hypothetical protein [Rikenellaceae bacterium]
SLACRVSSILPQSPPQQTGIRTNAAGTMPPPAQSPLASRNSSKSRQSQQQYPLNEAAAQTHTTVNTNRHKSAANRNGHNRSQPQAKQAAQSRTTVNSNRHKFAANRNGHKRSYRSKATHNMASRNSSSPPPQQAEYALSKACFNQATL